MCNGGGNLGFSANVSWRQTISFLVRPLEMLYERQRIAMNESTPDVELKEFENGIAEGVTVGVFKRCSLCGKVWNHRDDFLIDPDLQLNGYQGNLKRLLTGKQRRGLLLFTHMVAECGTTMAFDPSDFKAKRET
jgi:hypothetical protein